MLFLENKYVFFSFKCEIKLIGGMKLDHKTFELNDIVQMKKPHPCGENRWKIIRLGADIRIKCEKCEHSVMIPRNEFVKKMKKNLSR